MKKIYIFIVLIMLTNYAFASKEIWYVIHHVSWDRSRQRYFDDGNDYTVKPVGNGYCLYRNGTTPRSITFHSRNWSKPVGQFKINYISDIFYGCGYKHSSQNFEVHSLNNPSLSATFQWYSPYAKSSRIVVINDPDHIVTAGPFGFVDIGK